MRFPYFLFFLTAWIAFQVFILGADHAGLVKAACSFTAGWFVSGAVVVGAVIRSKEKK